MKYQINKFNSLPQALIEFSSLYPEETVINQLGEQGITRKEFSTRVLSVAAYLKEIGVNKGDKVAIISNTRPEWLIADFAIQTIGAISVAVYQSLPSEDVAYIIYDADVSVVFIENQEQADKIALISQQATAIPAVEDRDAKSVNLKIKSLISFEDINFQLAHCKIDSLYKEQVSIDQFLLDQIKSTDVASIVYTSGTTGPAKGVLQTHGNHLANIRQVFDSGLIDGNPSLMLFLPLAHSFARLMAYLTLVLPLTIKFPRITDRQSSKPDLNQVTKDIREASCDIVPIVPRVLEKMKSGVLELTKKNGIKGLLLSLTLNAADKIYYARKEKINPSKFTAIAFHGTAALRTMIKKQLFGDNFKFCISGGAKLNPQVTEFFDTLDIEVLEGYGLTETCVATNVNMPGHKKIGSVGPVLSSDIELQISDQGEICYRGPNITSGYHNRPKATAESWNSEHWFFTGDIGNVDADGFLFITGRKKEILVNSYGKKISCLNVEHALTGSHYISQAVVVGEARPYCVALVVPDFKVTGISDIVSLRKIFAEEIKKINKNLASHEEIKRFEIISQEFTVDNGLLTPTFKIKRNKIEEFYKDLIEKMYSDHS